MRGILIACFLGGLATSPVGAQQGRFSRGLPTSPDFFPIAVWLQAPSNAERYRAIGINTYVALWNGATEEKLDALEKAGMLLICEQSERSLRFKDRPTIVGWMHGDEPDNAQSLGRNKGYGPPIPPAEIVASYEKIRAADPDRPVLLNLGQGVAWDGWHGRGVRTNHPEDYPEYLKGCDIASFDIYPASHDRAEVAGNLWYVPQGVERLRRWTEGRKDVWCCIETTRINNPDVGPTPAQVRAEVWMALIRGAKGIIYFAHQFRPKFIEAGLLADSEMARAVAEINREIRDLAPVLNSPETVADAAVESSDPSVPIALLAKRHGNATYVFAASLRSNPTTGQFSLPIPAEARVEVLGESRTLSATEGRWRDEFSEYSVHLYVIKPAH
jgi:hypothetical protein